MENIKLNRCFCGKKPTISHQIHCDGEGEYYNETYVECPCGLRGKSFDTEHTAIGMTEISAANWWNEFVEKYKQSDSGAVNQPTGDLRALHERK